MAVSGLGLARDVENLNVPYRCFGAGQARELDGADSMTGSEKPRQTNLEIGGATRLAVPGRIRRFFMSALGRRNFTEF
jgi:hypothetical protein